MSRSVDQLPVDSPPTESIHSEPALGGESRGHAPVTVVDFEVRFQSIAELARGGQGRISTARDSVLGREVALKELLRAESGAAVKRFEREARLTARLQHPGIVSIYELARRKSGEPVLVMRRIQGKPFDQAISEAGSYEKRLALLPALIAACDAIAYAHQQGVIHRDIKPPNILLGDFGDTVVIDWGIAKEVKSNMGNLSNAVDNDVTFAESPPASGENAALTAAGAVVGTPAFMSPEQARGEPADAQSDVYALGAILYQLIAGQPAYRGDSSSEILKAVLAGPPRQLQELEPKVAPELASMVARAMAANKGGRYASAGELAEELKRFQTGRLVQSHSYSMLELLRRWAKKNALLLGVSGAFILLLIIGAVISVRKNLAEKNRANREAAVSKRVSDFMTSIFKVAQPNESRGNSVTARELLDKASQSIESGLADDPEVRARLMHSMGTTYRNLGLYPQAAALLEKAVASLNVQPGPEDAETLAADLDLIALLGRLRRLPEAEKLAVDTIAHAKHAFGPDSRLALDGEAKLALIYKLTNRYAEAQKLSAEALAIAQRTLPPDDQLINSLMGVLAMVDDWLGQTDASLQLMHQLIEIDTRKNGPDAPDVLGERSNLALTLSGLRHPERPADPARLKEAENILLDILPIQKRVLGADHPDVLNTTVTNLASVYEAEKRYPESEALIRERLAGLQRKYGPDHPFLQDARGDLKSVLTKEGRLDEAAVVEKEIEESKARSAALKK